MAQAVGTEALAAALAELGALPAERLVVTDRDALGPWETDWRGRWTGAPPRSSSQPAWRRCGRSCGSPPATGSRLVPQGGNSSMVGGATPSAAGDQLILSLRRLDRVRAIDARRATVEAGLVLERLHDAAGEVGSRFPLTLGARGTATVCGLVSTARAAPRCCVTAPCGR